MSIYSTQIMNRFELSFIFSYSGPQISVVHKMKNAQFHSLLYLPSSLFKSWLLFFRIVQMTIKIEILPSKETASFTATSIRPYQQKTSFDSPTKLFNDYSIRDRWVVPNCRFVPSPGSPFVALTTPIKLPDNFGLQRIHATRFIVSKSLSTRILMIVTGKWGGI